jgi:xyloglucan:xyloglucosyl transferase
MHCTGSGFKSKSSYRNGYFGVSIKVQPGYTAGVNTAFYVRHSSITVHLVTACY